MTAMAANKAIVNMNDAATPRLELLLLCDYHAQSAGTIIDHIHALRDFSRHHVRVLASNGNLPKGLDLSRFDGILIHYSLIAASDHYISPSARDAIREFCGLKAAFVQDDYRFINQTLAAFRDLGIHAVFGLAPESVIDDIYPPEALPGVRRVTLLAGYVPEHLLHLDVPKLRDRPIDIGYRGRHLPAWLGGHAQEKWLIAERVLADAPRYGLACDISVKEYDRIYGEGWIKFVLSCKSMLGVESGSSVCDFTGEIQRKVETHLTRDPQASFETLRDLYFKNEDGRILLNVISPRCFESAALKTLMILYEGNYSGCVAPWRHYVPLAKDHSNMDEVVAALRDLDRAEEIVERAYREVALNPANSFRRMVQQVDDVIDECFTQVMVRHGAAYDDQAFSGIETAAARKHRRRSLIYSTAHALIPKVEAALDVLPASTRLRLRETLRQMWRVALGLRSPLSRWSLTSLRLTRVLGVSAYLKLRDIRKQHPGLIDEVLFTLGVVVDAIGRQGRARTRWAFDADSQTLDFITDENSPADAAAAHGRDIEGLGAAGVIARIRWTVESGSRASADSSSSVYEFPDLVKVAQIDAVAASKLLSTIQQHAGTTLPRSAPASQSYEVKAEG